MNERARSMLSGFREGTAVDLPAPRRDALWRSVVATSQRPRRGTLVAVFVAGALAGGLVVRALHPALSRVDSGVGDARALVDTTRRPGVLSAEVGEPLSRGSELAVQLELYRLAQAARARGDLAAATEHLRDYQRRFPSGVFAPEVTMALQQLAR